MKEQLMYFELKSGYNDDGPAWIGKPEFSKTGTTIYFNGKAFRRGRMASGNYFDVETGEEYWISGIKKRGTNRHPFGKGKIYIDKNIVDEYLNIVSQDKLSSQLIIDNNIKEIDKRRFEELDNQKL